jgi:hypothetical protein
MSFTDSPSYLTSLGRRLAGGATVGSISVAAMTAMTGDTIAAFVGPALDVKGARSLNDVLRAHPSLKSASIARVAKKPDFHTARSNRQGPRGSSVARSTLS